MQLGQVSFLSSDFISLPVTNLVLYSIRLAIALPEQVQTAAKVIVKAGKSAIARRCRAVESITITS